MAKLQIHNLQAQSIVGEAPDIARAELSVLRNFAFGHWRAARKMADLLAEHEKAHAREEFGPQFEDARSFASSAILMAYAAMEAGLDELQLTLGTPAAPQSPFVTGKLIDRLNASLKHHGKPRLVKGGKLGQKVDLLRRIRNALAHPKAEWSGANPKHVKLGDRVKNAKLVLNPFLPGGEPVFPMGIMSAGVARWAADTARDFLNDINNRADLKLVVTDRNRHI